MDNKKQTALVNQKEVPWNTVKNNYSRSPNANKTNTQIDLRNKSNRGSRFQYRRAR